MKFHSIYPQTEPKIIFDMRSDEYIITNDENIEEMIQEHLYEQKKETDFLDIEGIRNMELIKNESTNNALILQTEP